MIIDTNVLHVAEGTASHAPSHCVIRCLDVIEQSRSERVALDQAGEILEEYAKNVAGAFPLGPGATFVRELLHQQYVPTRCELVKITPHEERGYDEFPGDLELAAFDRSDRKFVAVAMAAVNPHKIYNALDSDWAAVDEVLRRHDLTVDYLCPSFTSPTAPKRNRGA